MDNLDVDTERGLVDATMADPNIAAAAALSPRQAQIQAQARQLGNTNVVANMDNVNQDATNLGDLAALYQNQFSSGPGLLSQAAQLQAQRNTNQLGGLASIAAGMQGEQQVGAVGQAEANANAGGAIKYGNSAVMARLQGLQQELAAHYDNLSNHITGTNLARNIGLDQQSRALALKTIQDKGVNDEGNIALGNSKGITQFEQGMVGAGLSAAASGASTAYALTKPPTIGEQVADGVAAVKADNATNDDLFQQYQAQQEWQNAAPAEQAATSSISSYDSPFPVSGAPNAMTWQFSNADDSFQLQSTYQSGVA